MAQVCLKLWQGHTWFQVGRLINIHRPTLTPTVTRNSSASLSLAFKVSRLMRIKKPGVLSLTSGLLVGFLASDYPSVVAEAPSSETLVAEADRLYDQMKYEDIYNLLHTHKGMKNDEILWRLGRATYEKAKAAKTDDDKKILYREALNYVEEALALNQENFAVHKWMSILIDFVYSYEGSKARISQSYNTKNHMMKACELKPTDGTSWYLLGFWYYSIANIPWYQRKIASVVFATPPTGTYEEALEHFLHAEQVEPNFYSKNLLMIGMCYQKLGKKAEAKEYFLRTTNYTIKTNDDQEAVAEATSLLSGL
ncbi:regulator of microtubule dynamics protein 1-like [Homarus americanus]|uniref:Regulator of microtubule dynamics protein 1-like n=1 Tax=Homarus americanus TaxID=6706 RepID=A0A8J5MKK3_HOMAM|nr:regulator of microtubule dynamics protein 1-like [Homarus americanus]XP_042206792.1 regulator of microtubule dynamics protein 1-like [Homarus americanus]XP_042206793.1 regulator of microtubule dynamics protein 1-like [Homarus americanus]KAG7154849.1 Regulator of microtubule dynamics protein 1-like [Homarus americanus]